jgi:hypothetical protein
LKRFIQKKGEDVVDLFGKKKYEDRIKELESRIFELVKERDDLAVSLEKREDKIRKLTSAYQETNLALKAAKQKASLSPDRFETPSAEPAAAMSQKPQGLLLKPTNMEKLFGRLKAIRSPEDDLFTAYQKSATSLNPEVEKLAGSIRSERGMCILHCPQIFTIVLVPPLPLNENRFSTGSTFRLDMLHDIMETPVLVISAHAGDTFLGLALTNNDFEIQETVDSPVKEKHSKGGWSQKRFERLREEDIRNHADAVVQQLNEMAAKYRSIAKYAVIGGDPTLIKMISTKAGLPLVERSLEKHDEKRLDKLLGEVYSFTSYCYCG